MRILLYTHEFPPFAGGAGVYTDNLAIGLSALGHKVIVLAPKYREEDTFDRDKKQPYKVIRMSLPQRGVFRFILGSLYLIMNWIRLGPNVVHVTDVGAQISTALAIIFFPLRYSLTVHGSEIDWHFTEKRFKHRLFSPVILYFFLRANCILCISQAVRQMLLKTLPILHNRIKVVYNAVNLNKFKFVSISETRKLQRRLGFEGPVILTVARLIPEKGHDTVLMALSRIVVEVPNIKYIIIGTGPYQECLKSLVKRLSLEKNVLFMGKISDDTLSTYYAICDIFIMVSRPGSRIEGFGLVYAEAGACGKPVIASKIGGVPEVIKNGYNGILVDPFNDTEVEIAIRRLLSNPALAQKMGVNGRKRVEREFNIKIMAEETLKALTNRRNL